MSSNIEPNDKNSYILCCHTISKLNDMNIISFSDITRAYQYISENYSFVNLKELLEGYQKYLDYGHLRIGRNMLFSKDYIYSFDYNNMRYELYKINKMTKFVLLVFFEELSQIVLVECCDNHEDASNRIQVEYEKRYGIGKRCEGNYKFGQIFKCVYVS